MNSEILEHYDLINVPQPSSIKNPPGIEPKDNKHKNSTVLKDENESGTSDTKRNIEYSNKSKLIVVTSSRGEPNLSMEKMSMAPIETKMKYWDPEDIITKPVKINLEIINRDDPIHYYSKRSKQMREDEVSVGNYSNKNDSDEEHVISPQIQDKHRYLKSNYGIEMSNSYSEFDELNNNLYRLQKKEEGIMSKFAECLHT